MTRNARAVLTALLSCAVGGLLRLEAQTTYGYTGGSQTYTVPAGVISIRIKAWGAGGGAAAATNGAYGSGGGAGFVQADVSVTPGETITVLVGQGGASWNSTEGYAGGAYPNGGTATNFGGGGGGRSEVSGTNFDLVAGGGGGGGYNFSGNPGQGGFGGATTGGVGGSSPNNAGGQGGTQSAGGAAGHGDCSTGTAGAYKSGGAASGANIPGGAGGDGIYGGGPGGGGLTGVGDSGGGGGGGSDYASGSALGNILTYSGLGSTPGNSSDSVWLTSGCSTMGNYGAGVGATTATYRGGNGEVSISALVTLPVITSSLSQSFGQNQSVSYQITASGNPTSYGATGLPTGLNINTATGQITGNPSQTGTINSTISATSSVGTGTATLVWTITAAQIADSASVSPTLIVLNQNVTLTRSGAANFGIAWTQNVINPPGSQSPINLGNMQLGSMNYTPVSGGGTYIYQFTIVDNYNNQSTQSIPFTVNWGSVSAPTSFSATTVGSTFVTISWSGASAQLGIWGYTIYRNGSVLATVQTSATSGTYTDSTIVPWGSYIYTIATTDTRSDFSPLSSQLPVTADPDFEVFTPIP